MYFYHNHYKEDGFLKEKKQFWLIYSNFSYNFNKFNENI